MRRYTIYYDDSKQAAEYKNKLSGEVLDFFNTIDWKNALQDYYNAENKEDYYSVDFTVEYKDTFDLEYSFDVEFYFDENEDSLETNSFNFDLSYWYQENKTKKILFGLLGEKQVLKNESVYSIEHDLDFTLKCLNAFLRNDHDFLINNLK